MKRSFRRIMAMVLAMVMVFSMMPMVVRAAEVRVVGNFAELQAALADANVAEIVINSHIVTTEAIIVNRVVTFSGNGILESDGSAHGGTHIVTWPDGHLTLNGDLTITGGNSIATGGGITLYGGRVTMNGGTITNNTAVSTGGGVIVGSPDSEFTMNGGAIIGNTSAGSGGGVSVMSGIFILNDGIIANNSADGNGGGIVVAHNGEFIMNGGTISHNTAIGIGGGAGVFESTFTMHNGIIRDNTATSVGGGVGAFESTFTMHDGVVEGNISTSSGGGISVHNDSIFVMNRGTISGNSTTDSAGGGVNVDGGSTFTMNDGAINNNIAYEAGGGVVVSSGVNYAPVSVFTMAGGIISNNTSRQGGGGVFVVMSGEFTMLNGTISDNSGEENGGGVFVWHDASFTMHNGAISGNISPSGGGVFVDQNGEFTMFGGAIRDNTSTYGGTARNGGGIYTSSPTYSNLNIYPAAIFSGNTAVGLPRIFDGTPDVSAFIRTTSSSISGLHPLNNHDISFAGGTEAVTFTVTFADWDGSTLRTQHVLNGGAATAPQNPVRDGYTFIGWDRDFSNITENITVTALYEVFVDSDSGIDYDTVIANEIIITAVTFSFANVPGQGGLPTPDRITPTNDAVINLTRETVTLTGFPAIQGFSVNGGRTWTAGSPTPEVFVRMLNRDLELWLCFRDFNRNARRPQGSGDEHNIIAFPPINRRAPRPTVAVNFEIGAAGNYFLLTARGGTTSLKDGIEIGRANERGRAVDNRHFGRFFDGNGTTNGIPVEATRMRYFVRTAPQAHADGTFTAASRPRRITVRGNGRATNLRINYHTEAILLNRGFAHSLGAATNFTTVTERTDLNVSAYITNGAEIRIQRAATARRPATIAQVIIPQARAPIAATLPMELSVTNGRINAQTLRPYSALIGVAGAERWRAIPRITGEATFTVRHNPTARVNRGTWSGYAASANGTLHITWGVVGQDNRNRDIIGVTRAVITAYGASLPPQPTSTDGAQFSAPPTTTPGALYYGR